MTIRSHALVIWLFCLMFALPVPATFAQRTGQPASDVLSSEDLWGNPTFIGGVTNGGPHSHSVW